MMTKTCNEYWGLTEPAFENVADPEFFYRSCQHEEALNRLIYAVKTHKAGAMLIGDIGCGKTLISRALVLELMPEGRWEFGVITQPMLDPVEFLKETLYQLGTDYCLKTKADLLHSLHDQMLKNHESGKHTVLIVDETQAISNMETFDQLRLLTNFQANKGFLLTLVLVGQPELEHKIDNLPALADRISIQYRVGGLSASQTEQYVAHRLHIAGSDNNIFTKEAIKAVYRYSEGIPRRINNLCDLTLLVAFNRKLRPITQDVISAVADEVR
jgi:type II secretory pathway predicted ATPase ExeA